MRFVRKAQTFISMSKIIRIFLVMCFGSLCILGLQTLITVDKNSTSSTKKITKEPQNIAANLPDGRILNEQYNDDSQDFSNSSKKQIPKPVFLDENEYPGWRPDKIEESNFVVIANEKQTVEAARPTVASPVDVNVEKIQGRFLSGGKLIRPFPGMDIDKIVNPTTSMQIPFALPNIPLQPNQDQVFVQHQPPQTGIQFQMPLNPLEPPTNSGWTQTNQFNNINQPHLAQPGNPGNSGNSANSAYPPNWQISPPMGFSYSTQAPFTQQEKLKPPPIKERLVHFDLKGAPPKVSYFKEIFPLLKKLGATGLLMEYEDMFPYSGRLKIVQAGNAYSKQDIAMINKWAAENGLWVMPLVQTFGHLEFVLKHEEFRELREVDKYVSAVCPAKNESFQLVTEMIRQVMALHPNSTFLHIGADEVFHLGQCPVCSAAVQPNPFLGKQALFLSYISEILDHIKANYPGIRPVMWDDMFHEMAQQDIKDGLGSHTEFVEPMIWSYYTNAFNHLPQNGLLYGPVFPHIWGATAYKGSDGETRQMPDISTQIAIHTTWLDALADGGRNFQDFRGIVLTGWQRYDHFYPLCELFPTAIPSLAINLQILAEGNFTLTGVESVSKILACRVVPTTLDFIHFDPNLEQFGTCQFPGVEVYKSVHQVEGLRKPVKEYLEELEGRFPEYQMRNQYMQSWRAPENIGKIGGYEGLYLSYAQKARDAFLDVFDENTFNEWSAINVDPFLKRLRAFKILMEAAYNQNTWPSRPLQIENAANTIAQQEVSTSFPPRNPFLPQINLPAPLLNNMNAVPLTNAMPMPPRINTIQTSGPPANFNTNGPSVNFNSAYPGISRTTLTGNFNNMNAGNLGASNMNVGNLGASNMNVGNLGARMGAVQQFPLPPPQIPRFKK